MILILNIIYVILFLEDEYDIYAHLLFMQNRIGKEGFSNRDEEIRASRYRRRDR